MEQMPTVECQQEYQYEDNGNKHFMQQEQLNFLMRQQHLHNQHRMMQQINQKMLKEQEEEKKKQVQVEENLQQELQDETEITTLKYHGAEQFLQEETKQIVTNKEIEKTTISFLTIQKNDILQEITEEEKVVEQLKTEDDLLKINAVLQKNEMKEFQQSIQSHKNIVDKIKSIVESQAERFRSAQERATKVFADVCKHEQMRIDWELAANEEQAKLEAEMHAKRAMLKDVERKNEELNKEKMQLQLKLAEQREYLESLNKKEQELDAGLPGGDYDGEIKRLQELLKIKMQMLQELRDKNEDVKKKNDAEIALLNERKEESARSLEQLEVERLEITKKNEEVLQKIEICNQSLAKQQLDIQDIQAKILEKKKQHDELQDKLDEQNNDLDKIKTENRAAVEKVQSDIAEANINYEKRRQHLDQINRNIVMKMEEYSNVLSEKHRLDLEVLKQDTVKENIEAIEKKITKSQEKTKKLEEQLKKLEEDTTVQVLKKEKAYLESSLVYLNEKLDNTMKTIEEEKGLVGKLENENKELDKRIEFTKKMNEELEMKIKSFKENVQAIDNNQQPIVGILKPASTNIATITSSSTTTTKQYPMSPKKVQFDHSQSRIHEFSIPSSSSIDGGDPVVQQTNQMKTFDQLLEEFKLKKTPNVPMKKKIDFGL